MSFETLCDLFLFAAGTYHKKNAFLHKKGDRFQPISMQEFEQSVTHFSLGLCALGVEKGDKVGLLSENRPEWAIGDFGILCAGAITVPIYATLPADHILNLLADSDTNFLIVSNELQLKKALQIRTSLEKLQRIIVIDMAAPLPDGILTFKEIMALGEKKQKEDPDLFRRRIATVKPSDVASLIYTSGTAGDPKGVLLTHSNLVSNVYAINDLLPLGPDDTSLSFLPLSHILERLGAYLLIAKGVTIAYAVSVEKVPENMLEVSPTIMISVPRLYEKMYARVMDLALSGSKLKKHLFFWAMKVGRRHGEMKLKGETPSLLLSLQKALADRMVFRKIRARTGGHLRFCISGGAPLSREIGEFFYAAGITILEGYGLTETSPVITANVVKQMKFGTVGKVVPGVQVKIADDGEILCHGPSVMKGYYKREAETKEVLRDGWLRTGDIGHIDSDGFLVITDRKKDLLKTSGGKYVAPQPIESILKSHEMISAAVVLGDRRKFCCALIVPDFEKVEAWAKARGITFNNRAELTGNRQLSDYLLSEVQRLTPNLAQFEKIKKIAILPRPFTLEDGELTPTMKVKRSIVDKKYRDIIDALYDEE